MNTVERILERIQLADINRRNRKWFEELAQRQTLEPKDDPFSEAYDNSITRQQNLIEEFSARIGAPLRRAGDYYNQREDIYVVEYSTVKGIKVYVNLGRDYYEITYQLPDLTSIIIRKDRVSETSASEIDRLIAVIAAL